MELTLCTLSFTLKIKFIAHFLDYFIILIFNNNLWNIKEFFKHKELIEPDPARGLDFVHLKPCLHVILLAQIHYFNRLYWFPQEEK